MHKELVSIIIPVYNRTYELERAIQSVLVQSYAHFEIIVVDDQSTLDIKAVTASFNDKRIKYFCLEKKGNGSVARNKGVELASGEVIFFLDSDDELLENHIEKNMTILIHNNYDFLYGSSIVKMDNNESVKYTRQIRDNEFALDFLLGDGHAQTSSFCCMKNIFKKISWNEDLERHQDYDFFMQVHNNFKMLAVPENPTVIIHWNGTRKVHFDSCINFMNNYRLEINPKIYLNYNIFMHDYALRKEETKKYATHYQKEANYFIKYVSFLEYMKYYKSRNIFFLQLLKLKYFVNLLFVKTPAQ
jgi:glycosyltransferase involved in cell wall biosynthesis